MHTMTIPSNSQSNDSIWADESVIQPLQIREKTFYNADYFERIVMPLLDLPASGRILPGSSR
jgi:hypothetical protein